MNKVLVNRLGGLSLPRKSAVRLTDRPDMTLDVYRGRKTTTQQHAIPKAGMTKRVNVCINLRKLLYNFSNQAGAHLYPYPHKVKTNSSYHFQTIAKQTDEKTTNPVTGPNSLPGSALPIS